MCRGAALESCRGWTFGVPPPRCAAPLPGAAWSFGPAQSPTMVEDHRRVVVGLEVHKSSVRLAEVPCWPSRRADTTGSRSGSPLEAIVSEMYRREFRRQRQLWWIESSSGCVLGAENPIPRPSVRGFDHALQSTYLCMTNAAASVVRVAFRHLLKQSYVAAGRGTRGRRGFVGLRQLRSGIHSFTGALCRS